MYLSVLIYIFIERCDPGTKSEFHVAFLHAPNANAVSMFEQEYLRYT